MAISGSSRWEFMRIVTRFAGRYINHGLGKLVGVS